MGNACLVNLMAFVQSVNIPLAIGTRSVHVGSLSEVSQDTPNYNCTLLSIVTMLTRCMIAILQVMLKPRLIAMLCLMYAKGLFLK